MYNNFNKYRDIDIKKYGGNIMTENQSARKVVFIMTDTQRKDMVGCYGNKDMKTPHLDKLASEGMRFDRAYTTQPVCGPARSAIFTGTYPHSNGMIANSMPLGANVKTIGQRLTDNGIRTAYIGKWHLDGGDYFGLGRCPDGWDPKYWYDMRNYLEELTDEERRRSRITKIMDEWDVPQDFTYGYKCSNRAIDFLSNYGNDEFFLVVSYDEPHDPFLCPKPYSTMYKDYEFPKSKNVRDTLEDKPDHQKAWAGSARFTDREGLKIKRQYFFGCNSYVDYEIGRVLQAVEKYAPDALIIYTSDHGDMLCSHCLEGKGPVAYNEITNIPMIIKQSKVVKAGSVCAKPVSHIGITPTILDYFGIPVPKLIEGKSFIPILYNTDTDKTDDVFIEFNRYEIDHDGFGGYQPLRAVYDGRYKLVINLMVSDELYDLEKDPDEMVNLINESEYTDIRNRLHDKILDFMNRTRDPFRGYYWERRQWRSDAASATWDYTGMTRQRENEEYEPRQMEYRTGLMMTDAVRKR